MPRYYVDLDNNKLVAGPQSTQLASTPRLYQGDKPVLDLELLTRDNGVLGYYSSSASAINVRVGTLGGTAVASALTLSTVTLSATATATAGITAPVTATAIVSMLGSVTATATAGVNSPVNGLITATVTSLSHASASALLRLRGVSDVNISACGFYKNTPSVLISESDTLIQEKSFATASTSSGLANQPILISGQESGRVLNLIIAGAQDSQATSAASTINAVYVNDTSIFLANFIPTDQSAATRGLSSSTAGANNYFSEASDSDLRLEYSDNSVVFTKELRNTQRAAASAVLVNGKLASVNISDSGSYYDNPPDVWIIPNTKDYTLGSAITVTAATASGRTISCSVASGHGLVVGDYLQASGIKSRQNTWSASGVWSVVSATNTSIQYRIATIHVHPSDSVGLSLSSAAVRKILLRSYVSSISITSAGSGFSQSEQTVVLSTSDCGGQNAVITLGVSDGKLASSTIVNSGLGFSASSLTATVTAYCSLSGLTVTCAGSGYWTELPAISVDSAAYVPTAPGATPAVIAAGLNGNGTLSLSITCAGYGYTSAPTIIIAAPNGGDGIRVVTVGTKGVGYSDGTYSCTVSAPPSGGAQAVVNFIKNGSSQTFSVVNPGRGYTSAPVVTVPAPDLGGQVSGFTVTCAGAGYTDAPLVIFSGGGGTGAAATAILSNGTVSSISLDSAGSGYNSAPAVSLQAPDTSVYYSKQIDLSGASVTTLLAGGSSASAYLQVEEKRGADSTVLAQIPVTLFARVS